ncbi:MAG: polyribonucleotide nucleotidyltransferase [Alphaproteobacteria bacterium]|nr:polyribonucleotide nucleotidyltransferase [Alphaproteobacteria bacterium]
MFDVKKREIEWGGRTLSIETGKVARQADASVIVRYGDTVVMANVVAAKTPKPGLDFFPLTVNYFEKTYSAGKIPGGFFKREGRPTEKETLTARLIDRPIRPLFHSAFRNETQVTCTLLSHDGENNGDILAMVGTSAALTLSGIPFMGPIAGARVGYKDGEFILNPTLSQMEEQELDLIVAGTQSSVLMVESQARELPEKTMLDAVTYGHDEMQKVIDMIIDLAEECAKAPWDIDIQEADAKLVDNIKKHAEAGLREAYSLTIKQDRVNKINEVKAATKTAILADLPEDSEVTEGDIGGLLKKLESKIVRRQAIETKKRIDGRGLADVRGIECEVGVLPRAHGSALFTRGETQALVVATLGTSQDEQIIDQVDGDYREHFMLHYNFPPYSVGEAYPMRPPGRREIGHGKLAWRSLRELLPSKDGFPYTIRLVSEITESNGSSSMATVCGSSLAMMDAGVPLTAPCAGIAMGLIKEDDGFVVLSDILGDEDHLGDMDFKVAGTDQGVTALQMDIKIDGITKEIMEVALNQAQQGRIHILGEMSKALSHARDGVNENAPKITTIMIPRDKIREVIGSGGKVIREICEVSGAKVDIEDDGTVRVSAANEENSKKALDMIYGIVAEPEVGTIYEGKVVKIMDFGAFVNFMGARDGLVHISELVNKRVDKVNDVVSEGDVVKVKCLEIDPKGKVRLSMRVVDQETGEDITEQADEARKAKKSA